MAEARVDRATRLQLICLRPCCKSASLSGDTAWKKFVRNSRPKVAPSWATCLAPVQAGRAAPASESCRVAGIANGGWCTVRSHSDASTRLPDSRHSWSTLPQTAALRRSCHNLLHYVRWQNRFPAVLSRSLPRHVRPNRLRVSCVR